MLDRYPEADALEPDADETLTAELVVTEDVLVKAFALAPGARIDPHEHDGATNVFHVLEGTVTVVRDDEEEQVTAPAVVRNERGDVHGARNESGGRAVLTASLCPLPGSG